MNENKRRMVERRERKGGREAGRRQEGRKARQMVSEKTGLTVDSRQ